MPYSMGNTSQSLLLSSVTTHISGRSRREPPDSQPNYIPQSLCTLDVDIDAPNLAVHISKVIRGIAANAVWYCILYTAQSLGPQLLIEFLKTSELNSVISAIYSLAAKLGR